MRLLRGDVAVLARYETASYASDEGFLNFHTVMKKIPGYLGTRVFQSREYARNEATLVVSALYETGELPNCLISVVWES